jgi:hypothetical protein
MGGRGEQDDFVNEMSILSALLAAPTLILLFFLSAALNLVGASVLAGAGALAGFLSTGIVNRPLRVVAAGSAWLALFASGFLFATSSWS